MLKKQTGNMYEFVTHMWSPIKGRCSHDCSYCYMKRWPLPKLHLDEKDLKTDLDKGRFIFVGHTCDMFAEDVPSDWIERVLGRLCSYPKNKYLLQSKNPQRFLDFTGHYPPDIILGTTIETNRDIVETKAPTVLQRAQALAELSGKGFVTMVTIEPIFDFDLDVLIRLIILSNPEWVNIGADSKGHKLPEPTPDKIEGLIRALEEKTTVKLKANLNRICPQRKAQK